jgi:hypothetical protein
LCHELACLLLVQEEDLLLVQEEDVWRTHIRAGSTVCEDCPYNIYIYIYI